MPYYLYKCENKSCNYVFEELRTINKRNNCPACKKCNSKTKRIFHPEAGMLVMWRHPGEEKCLTINGPTRREAKYKIKDVAKENGWYEKMGLKR